MRRFLVAALLLIGVPAAHATLLQRFEIEDLARHSEAVAVVRVLEVKAAWEDDAMIRTRVRLGVERVIAGRAPREVTVVIAGGTVGEASATVGGMPAFAAGERMVVFLEPRKSGGMHVVGAFQGAFRLVTEAETGMPLAVREAAKGAAFYGVEEEDDGARSLYLDELEARVREVRR